MNEYDAIIGEYKRNFIEEVIDGMSPILNNDQLSELYKALNKHTVHLNFGGQPETHILDYENANKILLREFHMSKKLEGLSERTIEAYDSALRNLEKWTIKPLTGLTSEDLKEYLVFYQSLNNCSNVSLDNHRRVLSSFYRWCTDEEHIIVNPMKRIPKIKFEKKVKQAFTDGEVEKMRDKLNTKKNTLHKLRDKAIFEMLISSGVRVNELCTIKLSNMDFDENKGLVLGKGNKERIIYYSESAKQACLKYLEKRKKISEWLFLAQRGTNHIGVSGVERIVRDLGKSVNVEAHPHKFRRTFATNLIRKGMPIDQVQHLLGHTSLEVTLRYVETNDEALQMIHKKYTNF